MALNHGMDPKNIQEKQTILIPAGKLSSRDKEILAGMLLSFGHGSCECESVELLQTAFLVQLRVLHNVNRPS